MPIRQRAASLGLNQRESSRYSLFSAIRGALEGRVEGFEREISDEIASKREAPARSANSFYLPHGDLRVQTAQNTVENHRDLTVNPDTASELVGTDHRGDMFIDLLRNRQALVQCGVPVMSGLRGDVAIPKMTAAGTAYWLTDESTGITESTPTFGQVTGSPHEVGASVDISRKALVQSSPSVEMLVMDDLAKVLALAIDAAGIQGTGTNGQPSGVVNDGDINTVTVTENAPTWAQIIAFETAIASANADVATMKWLMPASVRGNLRGREKVSGQPQYMYADDGTVAGYPVVISNQVSGDLALFGDWNQMALLEWLGLEIVVDEVSLARERLIRVTAFAEVDYIVRQGAAFAVASNAMDTA